MARTANFLAHGGYVRHPDDKNCTCFWCGGSVPSPSWDYTPPRKEVALIDQLAKKFRELYPGVPFYAVTCCERCKNTMYYHKLNLLTMDQKRAFWAVRRTANVDVNDIESRLVASTMKSWQIKLADGQIVDKPEEVCTQEELIEKRMYLESLKPADSKPFNPLTDIADFGS